MAVVMEEGVKALLREAKKQAAPRTKIKSTATTSSRYVHIAFESSHLTRLNILQQAAAAVLGQANQQPTLALQLLS